MICHYTVFPPNHTQCELSPRDAKLQEYRTDELSYINTLALQTLQPGKHKYWNIETLKSHLYQTSVH